MLDRRTILAFFAATGAANTLLPGTLWAQIQPGTRKLTIEMVREAARLAGLNWTDQECQELLDSLSSFSRHAEGIDKATLTNASPLPIHFDPRPPGIAQPPLPAAVFRLDTSPHCAGRRTSTLSPSGRSRILRSWCSRDKSHPSSSPGCISIDSRGTTPS